MEVTIECGSFKIEGEYAGCGSHQIALTLETGADQLRESLKAADDERVVSLENAVATLRAEKGTVIRKLGELEDRVKLVEKLCERGTVTVHIAAVGTILGFAKDPIELCAIDSGMESSTCVALDCAKRVFHPEYLGACSPA